MIANVLALMAVATSVAFAFPSCTGVLNNNGLNGISFDSNSVLNSGNCGSSSFGPTVLSANTRSVGFVSARPSVSSNSGFSNSGFSNSGFSNNGFSNTFSLENAQVNNGGLYSNQLVNSLPLVSSQVLNSGSSCGSSSFGPTLFGTDSRSVAFPNARSGVSTGNSLTSSSLFNSAPVASLSSVASNGLSAVPSQVSADAPVFSANCNNQQQLSASPVVSSSSSSNLFSTGSSATPVLVSGYGNQMGFSSLTSSPTVVSGSLNAVPTQMSSDSAVLASSCNNQVLSGLNSGVYGKCGY